MSAGWLLLACATAACFGGTPVPSIPAPLPTAITVATDEPEVIYRDPTPLDILPIDRFMTGEQTLRGVSWYTPVTALPVGLTTGARGGHGIALGYKRVAWMIDIGATLFDRVFYYDSSGDGDLSDEVAHPMTKLGDGKYRVVIQTKTIGSDVSAKLAFAVVIDIHNGQANAYGENVRSAIVSIGTTSFRCGTSGLWGLFALAAFRVGCDLDRDGRLDLEPNSAEAIFVRDRVIELDGKRFDVSVSESADTLTFRETRQKPIEVAAIGKPIPRMSLTTTTNQQVIVGLPLRQFVVIDLWSVFCGPCLQEFPALAKLATRPDVLVLGVTSDDEDFHRRFSDRIQGITWPIVRVSDTDPIFSILHNVSFPHHALIDPAGVLVCRACSLDEIEQHLPH